MQKTFLKFMMFELVERMVRFRLILSECANSLLESAPGLYYSLSAECEALEALLLEQKNALNSLFSESAAGSKQSAAACETLLETLYSRLKALSQLLCRLSALQIASETHLFLKDVLPDSLLKQAGEHSVFLGAEGAHDLAFPSLNRVLVDRLSVLQKNNPLAWVGLCQSYAQHLLQSSSALEALKLDLLKGQKKLAGGLSETHLDALLSHAIGLRLLGPAYYFQALSEAFLNGDEAFLQVVEPALFFGLHHQNFSHKNLVILHEACERSKPEQVAALQPLSEEALASLFRAVEKAIPGKYAFNEKNMQRAIQLQERLSEGILLSSTPLFPVEAVAENLRQNREKADFSIYEPLSMLTEYPHSPKEIVNAGWLHKMERGPIWLYTIFNEGQRTGLETVQSLLEYQDHLLRKSIETSEIHRVLVCGQ
ncbi:hypothetical protein [Vampirovibrio chlorellavorus]|uniref:hypothetical protein n=1 Tax=Vampirovibrio chlorellavorus TaxID=758823 RepID=UPI0026EC7D9F|nr:hypothetical protein [Vampirovibrio chlorellavorus]